VVLVRLIGIGLVVARGLQQRAAKAVKPAGDVAVGDAIASATL
jgi:hypothetical protein